MTAATGCLTPIRRHPCRQIARDGSQPRTAPSADRIDARVRSNRRRNRTRRVGCGRSSRSDCGAGRRYPVTDRSRRVLRARVPPCGQRRCQDRRPSETASQRGREGTLHLGRVGRNDHKRAPMLQVAERIGETVCPHRATGAPLPQSAPRMYSFDRHTIGNEATGQVAYVRIASATKGTGDECGVVYGY